MISDLAMDRRSDTKVMSNKRKVIIWTSAELKIVCIKGHYQWSEKANYGIEESICESRTSQGMNVQNA